MGNSSELHFGCGPSAFVGSEGLLAAQVEQQRIGQRIGEAPDGRVEILHRLVVTDPGDIDPVFGSFQLVLEIEEVLIGLEVGLVLGHGNQSGQGS